MDELAKAAYSNRDTRICFAFARDRCAIRTGKIVLASPKTSSPNHKRSRSLTRGRAKPALHQGDLPGLVYGRNSKRKSCRRKTLCRDGCGRIGKVDAGFVYTLFLDDAKHPQVESRLRLQSKRSADSISRCLVKEAKDNSAQRSV